MRNFRYHSDVCLEGPRKARSNSVEIRTGYVPDAGEARYCWLEYSQAMCMSASLLRYDVVGGQYLCTPGLLRAC
jgi:hypothetical protein